MKSGNAAIVQLALEDMKEELSKASKDVQRGINELATLDTRKKAKGFRERAEKEKELLDTIVSLVGSAIELTVDVVTSGVSGAIKPAYDILTKLGTYLGESRLAELALEDVG